MIRTAQCLDVFQNRREYGIEVRQTRTLNTPHAPPGSTSWYEKRRVKACGTYQYNATCIMAGLITLPPALDAYNYLAVPPVHDRSDLPL